ncbi:hypothetical protein MTR_1g070325 [Medicago truncatula]|uniref:Uncharacterized protein n=1 Tax=Medicago truncatula TaxID=3880 RepID=A0A072VWW3_MEDTR|nr:hypothetical protein MTR_1g070325 [Medicago truncatula]
MVRSSKVELVTQTWGIQNKVGLAIDIGLGSRSVLLLKISSSILSGVSLAGLKMLFDLSR